MLEEKFETEKRQLEARLKKEFAEDMTERTQVNVTLFAHWSGAKGPTKLLLNYWKTSDLRLSNLVLFMSIQQIFAHIFATENEVSESTFSEFLEISRTYKKFFRTQKVNEEGRI